MSLDPDVVLVDFTLNEAAPLVQLISERSHRWPAAYRFVKRFDLVQFLYANWKQFAFLRQGNFFRRGQNYADLVEDSPRWEATKADLAEMRRLTDARHAHLLVVMWPVFVQLDDYPYVAKHRLVRQACETLGIPVLDLLETFRGTDARTLWASSDDHHPNPTAQKRVAEAVRDALEKRGFLPPPRPG